MTEKKTVLTERSFLVLLLLMLLLLWLTAQISLLAALILGAGSSLLLLQLDMQRRLTLLQIMHRKTSESEGATKKGLASVRTAALNRLPTPVLIIDRNHKIIVANSASRTILGDSLVEKDAFLYLRQPQTIAAVKEATESGLALPPKQEDGALRHTTSDDRVFDLSLAPIRDDDEQLGFQVIVFFYEVTSLLSSEQMRVDFVANASHELRTPLSSLIGSIETLQGPAKDDPKAQQRFLSIMQREAERMIRLIDDLLSLSRIEMSRHQPPQDIVDIQLAIKNTMNTVQPIAESRGVTFDLNLDDRASLVIADADQITQVLLNLLVNDAKYVDENSTVQVTTARSEGTDDLVLTIQDEGPGIAMEHLGRLTERFYRVDTARSRKMGGTGLGLAIVKHILLRHKSNLEISSRLGEGTVFSFRLPLAEKIEDMEPSTQNEADRVSVNGV